MTAVFGSESCRGTVQEPGPHLGDPSPRWCLAVRYPKATTGTPGVPIGARYWPLSRTANGGRVVRGSGGHWAEWWEIHPTEVQAKADALGVDVTALLCLGCQQRLARLIAAGRWNP